MAIFQSKLINDVKLDDKKLINGLLFLNSTGAIFRKEVGPNI